MQTPEPRGGPCKVRSLNCLFTEEETETETRLDPDLTRLTAELGAPEGTGLP